MRAGDDIVLGGSVAVVTDCMLVLSVATDGAALTAAKCQPRDKRVRLWERSIFALLAG